MFSLAAYGAFLEGIRDEAEAFEARRRAAFRAERERWEALPPWREPAPAAPAAAGADGSGRPVSAQLAANVWRLSVAEGDRVRAGDVVAVLEAMKMEVDVTAPCDGTVARVLCAPGDLVAPGQALLTLRQDGAEEAA